MTQMSTVCPLFAFDVIAANGGPFIAATNEKYLVIQANDTFCVQYVIDLTGGPHFCVWIEPDLSKMDKKNMNNLMDKFKMKIRINRQKAKFSIVTCGKTVDRRVQSNKFRHLKDKTMLNQHNQRYSVWKFFQHQTYPMTSFALVKLFRFVCEK